MTQIFHDVPYLDLAREIRSKGVRRGDRTKTGTLAVFSRQMRFETCRTGVSPCWRPNLRLSE
jgi:thymidylate synthase